MQHPITSSQNLNAKQKAQNDHQISIHAKARRQSDCDGGRGFGAGVQVTTTADTPILPNTSLVLQKQMDDETVAYISAAGATLHIQPGEGGYV